VVAGGILLRVNKNGILERSLLPGQDDDDCEKRQVGAALGQSGTGCAFAGRAP